MNYSDYIHESFWKLQGKYPFSKKLSRYAFWPKFTYLSIKIQTAKKFISPLWSNSIFRIENPFLLSFSFFLVRFDFLNFLRYFDSYLTRLRYFFIRLDLSNVHWISCAVSSVVARFRNCTIWISPEHCLHRPYSFISCRISFDLYSDNSNLVAPHFTPLSS